MPRHHTTAPHCVACRLRCEVCLCGLAPRLDIGTRLFLVVHSKEWGTATNTGHLARLAFRSAEVRIHGLTRQTVSSTGIDPTSPSTLVLYPGRGAQPLTPTYLAPLARPVTLLVADGNWNQAKNMMRRIPMLGQARPVSLPGPRPDLQLFRRNHGRQRRSTFEAIAQALGILEGERIENLLLDFFRLYLAQKKATLGLGEPGCVSSWRTSTLQ